MTILDGARTWLGHQWARLYTRLQADPRRNDRGDVPGWVMVTVMTAILVVAILGVFEPQIKSAISSAIDNVTNSGSE